MIRFQDLPVQCSVQALWKQLGVWKKGTKRKKPITMTKIDYRHSPVLPIPTTFKLIKNAVILIEWTQLTPEIFMHLLNKETRNVITSCRKRLKILSIWNMSNSALLWRCSRTFICARSTMVLHCMGDTLQQLRNFKMKQSRLWTMDRKL